MAMATKVLTSDRASAPLLRDVGHLRNAGDVGRELYDQRASRNPFRGGHHFVQGARIAAELQATVAVLGQETFSS